ncbi:odorant receptor 131-2-like [Nerophis lumbriciformis]|uniref:odorant receptor 131-2-like n=1 Tax=Nerophis lumbriciformis TaxID=546530 RepID=UPI002AE0270B|nr:odorant receptor 131-2-like [Nerophis lumbriciformis]
MLRQALSQSNVTQVGLVERVISSSITSVACLVFLLINAVIMFTLRRKRVFRETSRYILLFHLLLADTLLIASSQVLYLLHTYRISLTYPQCGVLVMLTIMTNDISPLVLVVMSLERYVAVCHPLRHASIITARNTGAAVLSVWILSLLQVVTLVLVLLRFPFDQLETLKMPKQCSSDEIFLLPVLYHCRTAFTALLFTFVCLLVVCSYIGVVVAARSASRSQRDKESARKAQKTLLLHLLQLGLILLSCNHFAVLVFFYSAFPRMIFLRIQAFLYVCFFFLPRWMASLIYGLRDRSIRVVLTANLFCVRTENTF